MGPSLSRKGRGISWSRFHPHQLREVLAAVEVERLHVNPDHALDFRRTTGIARTLEERRVLVDDAGAPPDLETTSALVVDDEEHDAVVLREVADGDQLPVAGIVGEGERAIVDHPEESRGAAAMLHMRPAFPARRRDEEAVGLGDV